jgi:hypothetical protein
MTLTHTLCDTGHVALKNQEFLSDTLTFPGADDYAAGTIVSRRAVATAITTAAGSNTGNGTCTAASVITGRTVPKVGTYVLTCTTAVTNGGEFKLVDPDGDIVATGLTMAAGAGEATVFKVGGLTFTLTDAGTDFAAGDSFNLPVVADGTLAVYSPTEKGGAQNPIGVLTYAVSKTGAGTVPVRVMVRGTVNKNRLVIDDGSSMTSAILDQLRDVGIVSEDVKQLGVYDNQ